jgi:hypothetical protein
MNVVTSMVVAVNIMLGPVADQRYRRGNVISEYVNEVLLPCFERTVIFNVTGSSILLITAVESICFCCKYCSQFQLNFIALAIDGFALLLSGM